MRPRLTLRKVKNWALVHAAFLAFLLFSALLLVAVTPKFVPSEIKAAVSVLLLAGVASYFIVYWFRYRKLIDLERSDTDAAEGFFSPWGVIAFSALSLMCMANFALAVDFYSDWLGEGKATPISVLLYFLLLPLDGLSFGFFSSLGLSPTISSPSFGFKVYTWVCGALVSSAMLAMIFAVLRERGELRDILGRIRSGQAPLVLPHRLTKGRAERLLERLSDAELRGEVAAMVFDALTMASDKADRRLIRRIGRHCDSEILRLKCDAYINSRNQARQRQRVEKTGRPRVRSKP